MKLIGLSGTNGSGKDTIAELIVEKFNYMFVSVTDLLRDEASKRNLPIERSVLRDISAEWRRESGLGVLVDKAVEKFELSDASFDGLVVVSLRNPGEVDKVHKLGGKVIWIDADPKIRYQRIYSRRRSDEDNKSFEQFLAEEKIEMSHSGDEATLNMSGVKDKADIFIDNDHSDIETFKKDAEQTLVETKNLL